MSIRLNSIAVRGATVVYGAVRALADLSVEIEPGDAVAVMGPNGAGKSTLLGLLSLEQRPTRGEVRINDRPAREIEPELRGKIGLLTHSPLVYPDLTVKENLELFARLAGLDDPAAAASAAARDVGIGELAATRTARVLSRGQLQRLSLARATLADPDLLLLDEPAAGLDSEAVGRIGDMLERLLRRGGMAVVVTHDPEVAASVANRALLLRGGRVVERGPSPGDGAAWRALYETTVGGEA